MQKIVIRDIISAKAPVFFDKNPKLVNEVLIKFLNSFLRVNEINKFLENNYLKSGIDFIDALFEHLNVSYEITNKDIDKIPAEGRLIIVSNHPLGGLDGLAMIRAITQVRSDVKIVANDVLQSIENIAKFILPVDIFSMNKQKYQLLNIEKALNNEEAVIFFPSGKVSRLYLNGIHDSKWNNGAIKFSKKLAVPIIPAFVHARNSLAFYLNSMIYSPIGMFMLPQELFKKRNSKFRITFGNVIPGNTFKNSNLKTKIESKLLKQHTYRVAHNKSGLFNTEQTVIHPVNTRSIIQELNLNTMLGTTYDKKEIYLVEHEVGKNILREISRLREITFRKVGEGTGKCSDIDVYDIYYKHIVLWDPIELQIVGSYRLGEVAEIVKRYSKKGLYNSSQFYLSDKFESKMMNSIEVGRSFIQPKYWRSNALDFIWQGIGAYISIRPNIKYLWGAVSISDSYSELAKGLIIKYYRKWYQGPIDYALPIEEYNISAKIASEINQCLNGMTPQEDYLNLKNGLKNLGFTIPVLYRKYIEMTNYGGSQFLSFCVDVNFNNSIDGLILVNLDELRDEVKERYYYAKSLVK